LPVGLVQGRRGLGDRQALHPAAHQGLWQVVGAHPALAKAAGRAGLDHRARRRQGGDVHQPGGYLLHRCAAGRALSFAPFAPKAARPLALLGAPSPCPTRARALARIRAHPRRRARGPSPCASLRAESIFSLSLPHPLSIFLRCVAQSRLGATGRPRCREPSRPRSTASGARAPLAPRGRARSLPRGRARVWLPAGCRLRCSRAFCARAHAHLPHALPCASIAACSINLCALNSSTPAVFSSSGVQGASYFAGSITNVVRNGAGEYLAISSRGNFFLTWQVRGRRAHSRHTRTRHARASRACGVHAQPAHAGIAPARTRKRVARGLALAHGRPTRALQSPL
jgi:hypothetical protein